jgi:hypothetical protein
VSFASLGASPRSRFQPETGEGWCVVEVVGRGRCVQFGKNDVVSKVWVAARASLVGLSGVSDGFSCTPPLSRSCGGVSLRQR